MLITVFNNTDGAYLYKNKIELYGHYLSGLMMIKPLGNQNYKVAITTEFGAKIMDFEITDGKFIMHEVLQQMNRKRIIKMIEADMMLLFGVQSGTPAITELDNNNRVFVYNGKPLNGHYTLDSTQKVVAIDGYRKNRKMVESTITYNDLFTPATLNVSHTGMPVQIEMTLIKAPDYVIE